MIPEPCCLILRTPKPDQQLTNVPHIIIVSIIHTCADLTQDLNSIYTTLNSAL